MIRITFIDGEQIDITEDTTLIGISNAPRRNDEDSFYIQQEYDSDIDKGLALASSDDRRGITGFILSHDCFTLGQSDTETIYMTSAIKSISVI